MLTCRNLVDDITLAEKNGVKLTEFTYTYQTSGDRNLRHSVTDLAGHTTTYGYDTHSRLTSAIQTDPAAAVLNTWAYGYDPMNNRTMASVNGVSTAAAFNAANQLCWTVPGLTAPACDQTPPTGRTDYDHDAAGNTLSAGTQTFTYNQLDQTVAISDPAGATDQDMGYAGATQDERLTRDGTDYLTGPFGTVTETTSSQATRYRYDDTGTLLARQGPGGTSDTQYYLRDGLGSIVALTDHTGVIVANYTYDPYGQTLTATGPAAATNPWRYAAGYTDDHTGLVKFGTRYYQPTLGQWTQPDHWGPDPGYTYTNGNPANRVDPTGRDACMGAYAMKLTPQTTPKQCGGGIGPGSAGVPPPAREYSKPVTPNTGPTWQEVLVGIAEAAQAAAACATFAPVGFGVGVVAAPLAGPAAPALPAAGAGAACLAADGASYGNAWPM